MDTVNEEAGDSRASILQFGSRNPLFEGATAVQGSATIERNL